MDTFPPMLFDWDGETFKPVHPRRADRFLTVGERYCLAQYEDRSTATHNHEFAWLRDAWLSLPESLADLYPSADHLRKRALIEAGYYNETIIDCDTAAAAARVAAALRSRDAFTLVLVRDIFVIIREAKSQSRRAMKKHEFQESKNAIIEVVSAMIGVKPAQIAQREREVA
jgi:hypothetical protein